LLPENLRDRRCKGGDGSEFSWKVSVRLVAMFAIVTKLASMQIVGVDGDSTE
jgi:hypothetical protein